MGLMPTVTICRSLRRGLFSVAVLLLGCFGLLAQETTDRTSILLEALQRLKDQDIEANPALKKAVLNVLEKVRGKSAFVDVVRDFKLTNEVPALLEFAIQNPRDPNAAESLKTLLQFGGSDRLKVALTQDATASPLINPLGDTGDNRIAGLLLPVVGQTDRAVDVRRAAVRSVARVQEGALGLVQLARDGRLASDLKLIAATELSAVRWPAVKSAAAGVLPPPATRGNAQLPPLAELIQMRGDSRRGAAVFRRPEVNCISCHLVGNDGVDFGPALSEIGSKLGREALVESILDPSAGISFGFEAWQFTLKGGDEAFGLIASETEQEVILKLQGGSMNRLKKSEIEGRTKQALSIMPIGLQASLSTQEFVDLIEYLASLKKP